MVSLRPEPVPEGAVRMEGEPLRMEGVPVWPGMEGVCVAAGGLDADAE